MEGQGGTTVQGPITGQGLIAAAAQAVTARATARDARVAPPVSPVEVDGEEGGRAPIALAAAGGGQAESEEGEGDEEVYPMLGVIGAHYKKSAGATRMFRVLWEHGDDTLEPELGHGTDTDLGIDPTHVYGECFEKEAGMTGRRIVYTFATGTSSNVQQGEALDIHKKRKKGGSFHCIVREVRRDFQDVLVAWEVSGQDEDDWKAEPLQLHNLEQGTSWKLFTDASKGYLRGLKCALEETGRRDKRKRKN